MLQCVQKRNEVSSVDWLSGIMRVIDYIEDHLTEEIDVNTVAKEAACSSYYLQKLFSVIFGMTIGEYIRCRRLSCRKRAKRFRRQSP